MTAELAPLTVLKGVGPSVAARLSALHLHSLQDLLFHLPLRYQDRTRITPIAASHIGSELLLEGEVLGCDITFGRRRSLLCRIKDATGIITLRFYHFSAAQKNALTPGARIRCYGEVRGGKPQLGPQIKYKLTVSRGGHLVASGRTQDDYGAVRGKIARNLASGSFDVPSRNCRGQWQAERIAS